jgi:hypothetical protein
VIAERPTAAVFGAIVALAFVVAFAAAAVLRPQSAPRAASAAIAPAAASEETHVASIAVPSLSRVPAVPGLRLPVRRHRVVPPRTTPTAALPVVAVATAVPTPVPTARPVVVAPPKPTTPNVGQTFDSSG